MAIDGSNDMPAGNTAQEAGRGAGSRIGFWLGLALFVALLVAPAPDSVHRAVREHFADEIRADARGALDLPPPAASSHQAFAPADTPAFAAALDRAVASRARVLMAAAAVTALVACWWITVALPIPVTSLLPLALFPLVGVLPVRDAAVPYANPNVFLFLGGFIIALAIERWDLHRRIALHIVLLVGSSRSTVVLGFMVASALLSMWISNTATTLMMLPIGLAIVSAVADLDDDSSPQARENFSAALMLGIAYAASIGGVATPIGTPPNIAFQGLYGVLCPGATEIGFGLWMIIFVPLVVLFLPVVWLVLTRLTCRLPRTPRPVGREVLRCKLAQLGPMRRAERRVLTVFVATGLLWMTRSVPLGAENYGWSALLEGWLGTEGGGAGLFRAGYISDTTVALVMAAMLFVIPAGGRDGARRGRFLMDWATAQRLPWGILLLFGGGFSIAAAFGGSGLSYWCGTVFAGVEIGSPLLLVACLCLAMTFLTEITSNTATTQVMLPILARVSQTLGIDPLMLMLPATISASCAFMLPVATPPNAIVFGSGCIRMGRMVRTGIILNLVGVLLVTGTFYLIARPLLGIDAGPHTPPAP